MILGKQQRCAPDDVGSNSSSELCATSCNQCIARHVSMCSVLKDSEVSTISEISKCFSLHPKQLVCAEGDQANYLFTIQTGCIRLSKMLSDGRRQIIDFLFPGEFFGLACANGYTCSAETITDVNLCRMPRTQIFEKFIELPVLGQKVLDITRTELQASQDQMLLLGRKSAKEKLCSFLLSMSDKSNPISHVPDGFIYLPMSRSDIADYLGLTIETISRQFTILSKEKIISLEENHYIKIIDEDRMRLIASCA